MTTQVPRNNDITKRPGNTTLRLLGIFWVTFYPLLFGVGFAVAYVFLTDRHPVGVISLLLFVVGCGVGAALYLPFHFKSGREKSEEFMRAGGDPTGITPFMFGAMGGNLMEDGTWEWYTPSEYGDGGNSVA